ncbi:28S ribosomal protein S7, mitochondrial, partial [Stegodyphus mimosarum]
MAFRTLIDTSVKLRLSWSPLLLGVRNALYPAWYLQPISDKKELEKLEQEGKLSELKVVPVKPASCDLTNSIYDDVLVKKFTNMVMMWSNKTQARQLVHDAFARIKRIQLAKYHSASDEEKSSIELDPRAIFTHAIENCKPVLALTPIKKGGITYQVPVPISTNKSRFMAMKWLIMSSRDKEGEVSFVEKLSNELLDAYHNEGQVIKRKQDLHKICEANKAYAHYRWS